MIDATLDTNVLASGVAGLARSTSTPGEVLRRWFDGGFRLVVSEHILGELARALEKPYFRRQVSIGEAERALRAFRRRAAIVTPDAGVTGVASHAADDLVLSTAVSAGATYLVSGDRKLQQLGSYAGVIILSPRAFLELLLSQERG